jgi:hypothetical protein
MPWSQKPSRPVMVIGGIMLVTIEDETGQINIIA